MNNTLTLGARFPALRSRNFRLLWFGQGVSAIGSTMQVWAINWQLYELTHSTLALGLIGLFRVVPIVLFSLVGGTVADAWDRRRVMLATQVTLAGVAAALGALTVTRHMTGGAIYALTEGLQFVWRTPILVWTLSLDALATFFSSANALLPVFASDILHVGARGYGVLAAAVGALAAGAVLSLGRPIARQGRTVLWAVVVYGLATVVFGASRLFWLSWLALAVVGVADSVSTVLRQTIRQLVTPDRLRGRMTSVNMIFFMGGPQLGELEAGLAAAWLGGPWAVITGGMGCLLTVALVAARGRVLRDYRASDDDRSGPPP